MNQNLPNTPISVLMIDAAPRRHATEGCLREEGYRLHQVDTAEAALRAFRQGDMQVVVLALRLTDRDALALLTEMMAERPEVPIIVSSPATEIDRAVEAMRAGAHDFLVKPYNDEQLVTTLKSAFATPTPGSFLGGAHRALAEAVQTVPGFVGTSPLMQRIYARIRAIAGSSAPCFLTGESGTGKDLCARAIHALSPTPASPFVVVNCAALSALNAGPDAEAERLSRSRALALSADGGTLFLDEICDLAPALQTYLVKLIETSVIRSDPIGGLRPVTLRVICASRHDPQWAIRTGRLREDLYYRLNVVGLQMPPLRQRRDDILPLAQHALSEIARGEGQPLRQMTAEVRTLLMEYDWPGNIRELYNSLRAAVVMSPGSDITPDILPAALTRPKATSTTDWAFDTGSKPPAPANMGGEPTSLSPHRQDSITSAATDVRDAWRGMTLAEIERSAIEAALARHDGSVPRAARELAVAPSTLYRKMAQWTDPAP
jgi:two-component system, repressor protein LuxO